jgi:hypothetical protein
MRRMAFVFLVAMALTACGSSGSKAKRTTTSSTAPPASSVPSSGASGAPSSTNDVNRPCGRTAVAPARYRHVIWLWMENHNWSSVIGTPPAPYQTSLVKACGALTNQAIVGSPSLPNYIGATAGQTFGIKDDASPSAHPINADNLFRQVRTAGGTALSYQEDMPSNCNLGNAGTYAVKHNPAAYYMGADDRSACMRDDVPLGTPEQGPLADALTRDALPTFAFITPNLCNDTHDCPVSTGDAWLKRWIPRILSSAAYQRGDLALILGYDEYTPMPNAWIAPSVRPGSTFTPKTDQYTLLRATEQMLGLPYVGAAATAVDVRAALNA